MTSKGSFRSLAVDLGSKHSRPALEVLLRMEKRRNKVRSALVFTKNGYIHSAAKVATIFELLSKLPNLKQLTVDFHHFLPLQALAHLSESPRLKTLVLEHVQFNETEGQDPSPLLTNSQSLQELKLLHCKGTPALQTLFTTGLPPSLRRLTLANTKLGPCTDTTAATLTHLVSSGSNLQGLRLRDVPNLTDGHLCLLLPTNKTTSLTELEFTSNILGPSAGRAIVTRLHDNQSRSKLEALKLHLDWEDCGSTISEMLLNNTQLKQLDLRLYGDDDKAREDAILIAHSLRNNTGSGLRRLRLCLELERGEEEEAIVEAFDTTMDTNETLSHLEVGDTLEDFPLPLSLESKLRLNRSGAPKLWRRNHATQAQFVQALCNQKDDLTTLYQILRNQPTLMNCVPTEAEEDSPSDCSSDEDYHPVKPNAVPQAKQSKASKRARTKRFFQRRVRSIIFATSA